MLQNYELLKRIASIIVHTLVHNFYITNLKELTTKLLIW